jgi:hypothetical protein
MAISIMPHANLLKDMLHLIDRHLEQLLGNKALAGDLALKDLQTFWETHLVEFLELRECTKTTDPVIPTITDFARLFPYLRNED